MKGRVPRLITVMQATAAANISVSKPKRSATMRVNNCGGIAASSVVACKFKAARPTNDAATVTTKGEMPSLISNIGHQLFSCDNDSERTLGLSAIPSTRSISPEAD